jgi:hypothetical protein
LRKVRACPWSFDANNAPTTSSRGQPSGIEIGDGQKLGLVVPKPNLLQALDSTQEPNEVNVINPIWSFIYNLNL